MEFTATTDKKHRLDARFGYLPFHMSTYIHPMCHLRGVVFTSRGSFFIIPLFGLGRNLR